MTGYPLSRAMSAATAAYAVFALVRPSHLHDVLEAPEGERAAHDRLARTYGVRDLTTSALVFSGSQRLARAGMALRISGDLGDCAVLVSTTPDPGVRRKVAAVTLGWAALNAAAWLADERGGSR
jgi:hypothetical protein